MNELIRAIQHDGLHSVTFEYKGIQYIISGYWMIVGYKDAFDPKAEGIKGTEHFFDNKEQLLEAKIFDGKDIKAIAKEAKILEIYNDWD